MDEVLMKELVDLRMLRNSMLEALTKASAAAFLRRYEIIRAKYLWSTGQYDEGQFIPEIDHDGVALMTISEKPGWAALRITDKQDLLIPTRYYVLPLNWHAHIDLSGIPKGGEVKFKDVMRHLDGGPASELSRLAESLGEQRSEHFVGKPPPVAAPISMVEGLMAASKKETAAQYRLDKDKKKGSGPDLRLVE